MSEIKIFSKDGLTYLWSKIKSRFMKRPRNERYAKQGNFLKYVDSDTTEWAEFPAMLNYKGVIATYDELTKVENPSKGDVYTVTDQSNSEYFYNGTTWEFMGKVLDGNYVKISGDTMTGALKVKKGNGYYTKINDNAIELYHEDGTTKALEAKRNKFELKSSDGTTLLKVEDDQDQSSVRIGYGANSNSIILGEENSITQGADYDYQLIVGADNTIGTQANLILLGHKNTVHGEQYKNAALLVGGNEHNIINCQNSIIWGDESNTNGEINCSIIAGVYIRAAHLSDSAIFGNEQNIVGADTDGGTVGLLVSGSYNELNLKTVNFLTGGFDYNAENDDYQTGNNSVIAGANTILTGKKAFVHGSYTKAYGENSHAEGYETATYGTNSHTEGSYTRAFGKKSHAEGWDTKAYGHGSHAEGSQTTAGYVTSLYDTANNLQSLTKIAELQYQVTQPSAIDISGNIWVVAENGKTFDTQDWVDKGNNIYTFRIWKYNQDPDFSGLDIQNTKYSWTKVGPEAAHYGDYSHTEGLKTTTTAEYAHAEGVETSAEEKGTHAEGYKTAASHEYAHSEGIETKAVDRGSHAEGYKTVADGQFCHAEGSGQDLTIEAQLFPHGHACGEDGRQTHYSKNGYNSLLAVPVEYSSYITPGIALYYSKEEEYYPITAVYEQYWSRVDSHDYGWIDSGGKKVEFISCTVSGAVDADPEGDGYTVTLTISNGYVSGSASHGEGIGYTIDGAYSHAEGAHNTVNGMASHAEGCNNTNDGDYALVAGIDNKSYGLGAFTAGAHNLNKGTSSIAIGSNLEILDDSCVVMGVYNSSSVNENTTFVVGNGCPGEDANYPHNAIVVETETDDIWITTGSIWIGGRRDSNNQLVGVEINGEGGGIKLTAGGTSIVLDSTKLQKLITLLA